MGGKNREPKEPREIKPAEEKQGVTTDGPTVRLRPVTSQRLTILSGIRGLRSGDAVITYLLSVCPEWDRIRAAMGE